MLNCDWLLGREAVDSVSAQDAGDASLGYSLCIWAANWFQPRFQLCPDDDDDASSAYGVLFCREACGVLLSERDFR